MEVSKKKPRLVGELIKKRREALNLSQKALGQLFNPPVTTQFVSNLERGITSLPPVHVPVVAKNLQIDEAEIMALLEREYSSKLMGRVGMPSGEENLNGFRPGLVVADQDLSLMKSLYEAFQKADAQTRQSFITSVKGILKF